MTLEFNLASFELSQHITKTAGSSRRCYIIIAISPYALCEHLLCDDQELLVIADEPFVKQFVQSSEHYLGLLEQQDLWVRVVVYDNPPHSYQWLKLRSLLDVLSEDLFTLGGRALQIAQWFYDHQYCGRCGELTVVDALDRAKVCVSCQLRFYPRISPCMITLVTRSEEILLAYHRRASRPVYTTLAGFVEAGESVEACIRREVYEEVGIKVGGLQYFQSQPWPFPGQLMLGFFATYESGELRLDEREILDAKWFRYDELPAIPPKHTLAAQLIAHYVAQFEQ